VGGREFDVDFLVAVAQLSSLWSGQVPGLDRAGPDKTLRSAARGRRGGVLDDLVGGRDEETALALDLDSLSSLHRGPSAGALSAVERAQPQRTRASARSSPAGPPSAALGPRFSGDAASLHRRVRGSRERRAPLLPGDLQRIFEAEELLAWP